MPSSSFLEASHVRVFACPSARAAAAAAVASDKGHRPAAVHCHCIRLQSPPTPLTEAAASASAAFIIVLILPLLLHRRRFIRRRRLIYSCGGCPPN